jgi:hypothetical protein
MPIELGYVTLPVKDATRAAQFFGALFGWTFEHASANGAHVANTKLPLGISTGGPTDLHFLYFRVDDIAAMKAKVVALGGEVREEGEAPSGLNATCTDGQGTIFSLWQPAPGF